MIEVSKLYKFPLKYIELTKKDYYAILSARKKDAASGILPSYKSPHTAYYFYPRFHS